MRLDKIALILGFIGSAVALILLSVRSFHPIYSIAVAVGIVALSIYAIISERDTAPESLSGDGSHNGWAIPSAAVLIIGSLVVWMLRPEQYVKPLAYYILIALASGALFVASMSRQGRTGRMLVVVLAAIIGLAHIWTENLIFPSLLGIDSWVHYWTINDVLPKAGTEYPPITLLNMGGSYSLFHVYLGWIMNITGMTYKMAALAFWATPQVVGNIVLVFLIGRSLSGDRTGMIASVMVASATWPLFFGSWVIPNGIGATLSLIAALCILTAHKQHRYWMVLPALIVVPIAILTHVIATAWVIGTILVLGLALLSRRSWSTLIPVTAIIAVLAWYNLSYMHLAVAPVLAAKLDPACGLTYATGSAPVIVVDNPVPGTTTDPSDPEYVQPVQTINLLRRNTVELLVNSLGMMLYIALGMTGLLIQIKRRTLNKLWVVLCVGVMLIGFVPQLFGFSVIEHRWYYLGQIVMSIPLAMFLAALPGLMSERRLVKGPGSGYGVAYRDRPAGVYLAAGLVSGIIFLSAISIPANATNRVLSDNLVVRYGLTAEELDGVDQLRDSVNSLGIKTVGTDPLYAMVIMYDGVDVTVEKLEKEIVSADFSKCDTDAILLRKSVYSEPFGYGSGTIYRLKERPGMTTGYREIWSNDSASLLVKEDPI